MIRIKKEPIERRLSFWQSVFLHSRVNGAIYEPERLPRQPIQWPEGWLTKKLKEKANR